MTYATATRRRVKRSLRTYQLYAAVGGLHVLSNRYADYLSGHFPIEVEVRAYSIRQAFWLAGHRVLAFRHGAVGVHKVTVGRAFRYRWTED